MGQVPSCLNRLVCIHLRVSPFICWSVSQSSWGITTSKTTIPTRPSPSKGTGRQLHSGEPLKKKKRLDPAIIKHREERRKKKLEKQIRRLEKHARQLKPIDEVEVPLMLVDQKELYTRTPTELTSEEVDKRSLLMKDWARYKYKQSLYDLQQIDRLIFSQQQALDELRKESEELYQEAIQIDPALLPFSKKGPVFTPPIKDYESPDGEYIDTSKKWGKT